jgi:SAM-dependent methyltransferase
MLKQMRRRSPSGTALWDEHWRQYDTIRYDAASLRWDGILDLVRKRIGRGRLLEAGCGLGRYALHIESAGGDVIGIDFVHEPLRRIRAHRASARLAVADLSHLPFAPQSFDTILCLGLLEHFESGSDAPLAELAAVLRPGGWLIVTVPYANRLKRRRARRGDPTIIAAGTSTAGEVSFYQYCFTREEARSLVESAGLRVILDRRISRLFWLLGRRSAGRLAAPASASIPRRRVGFERRVKQSIRDFACMLQWAIPPDLTSHMIAVVGQKPESGDGRLRP